MKRLFFVLILAAVVSPTASAQQRRSTVNGVVADAETRQSLIGVVVELIPASDSTKSTVVVSGAGGAFSTGLGREEHDVRASMIGYETERRRVDITEARQTLDTLYLRQGIQIEAVVKQGVAMRTSVRGDTLIYNADAYKVAADANVSGLLEKMPGIKVDGGTVEAQGETVKKVLIDNREFFGDDVAAAISSLPAEAVKNIEVFDKLSDNAEFTGIDDGEGYKAINITTRESMRQGIMGQVSALYGTEPPEQGGGEAWKHYGLAGGNVNIFNGDAKITIGGTLNNLNERHFTSQDILGAGDDDGIARVGRFQFNYIDELGKNNQWKIDASYSYNITDADALSSIDRDYFPADDALYSEYKSETQRVTVNRHHSFRGRIDWKPNANHELRIRPILNFQGNDSRRNTDEIYTPVDGSAPINLNNTWSNRKEGGYMMGLNANYRVRLGKPGRTLSLFFNTGYDPDDRQGESYTLREDGLPLRQSTPSFNYDFNVGGGLTYTEPVSPSSLINLDYNVRYSYSDQDRKAYLWDFAPSVNNYLDTPDTELSGVYNSAYTTHRVGPGYRLQKGKTSVSASVSYQYSTLGSARVLPREHNMNQSFNNVTYSVLFDSQFESGTSIRMRLFSGTRNPGVFDLQDVLDISNIQNISKGNLNLKPSYNNMFFGQFIFPKVEKGRTLAINIGGNYTTNAIVGRTISDSPGFPIFDTDGNQMTDPTDGSPLTLDGIGSYSERVNMDGRWDARLGIDYGFPVPFLRSNLNLEADLRYSEAPSQIGRWTAGMAAPLYQTNYLSNLNPEVEITLGSNISEKVDFRVSYEAGYNRVKNSHYQRGDSEYLEHEIDVDFKFVLPAYFTLAGNVEYYNNKSISGANFTREYFIANAAIGKKVLRSRQGEVSIFVNDIFNQNVGFRRNFFPLYVQNQINSVIGRYIGVKFTWNIRKFGKNASTNMELYNTGGGGWDGHGHGGRGGRGPGGPPPGGGRGG